MNHKMKINMIYSLFIIAFLISCSYQVNAEVKNKPVCVDKILYNISWDTTKNTAINENVVASLSKQDIDNRYFGSNTEANSFTSSLMSSNCYIESGKIYTCPSSKELDKYDTNLLHEKVSEGSSEYKYIKIDYNVNNDTYTVRIKDIFDGKVKVRAVKSDGNVNRNGENPSTSYSDYLNKSGDYFVLANVEPTRYVNGTFIKNEYIFEFYINDSSSKCNTTYIASFNLVMSMIDDTIQVPNPAKNNKAEYGCDRIENFINDLLNKKVIDSSQASTMKAYYGSLCYVDKVTVTQYHKLKEDILKQYSNMVTLYGDIGSDSGISNTASNSGTICNNGSWTSERIVKEEHGSYWDLVCKEKYYSVGEKPKLVRAGGGFKYSATFKAEKTCTLTQNPVQKVTTTVSSSNIVVMLPQCVYSCYTVCSYDEKAGRVEGKGPAGPSEEFDSCVQTCDGGKYSQSCINACYEKTYSSERDLPEVVEDSSSKKTMSFLDSGLQRMDNSLGTVTSSAGGTFMYSYSTSWGVNTRYSVDFPTEHCGNVGVVFSTYCDTHNGKCEVFESVGPAGCTDTPNADYKEEITVSMTEHAEMIDLIDEEIPGGDYEIEIADSYLNNNGKAYVYKISTKDQQNVIVNESYSGGVSDCETENWLFGDQGERATSCKRSKSYKTVTVSLPLAYLNRKDATALYEIQSGRYYRFNANTPSTGLEFNSTALKNVYPGGNKYYTNILSDNVNVNVGTNKVTLVDTTTALNGKKAGISVKVSNFGSNHNYNNTVNCFYGVYNDTVEKCVYPCTDDDEGGITIIFRPIDLNDNFPNDRNPRWNWTDKASVTDTNSIQYSLLNYKVSPSELNKQIEEKGYNIYTDTAEVDYDIVLTPENLRNIKQYNKKVDDINKDGSNNYLDYDMTCGTRRNREYCYSNFLDNTNYVTYNTGFNATTRKDIAICNNTYNQACTN